MSPHRPHRPIPSPFWRHVLYHRELYAGIPLAIGLVLGAIAGVRLLTGRAVVDDPGAIVGWLYNFAGAILIVILTGFAKPHLFDDIDTTKEGTPWWRILIDTCETAFLLLFFAYLLRH